VRREGGDAQWLNWDPDYSIGVDAIDRQHRKLFDISNRFYDAWRQHARRAALRRIFDELLEYAGYHFAEEERLMEQVHYPDLTAHHTHHEHLVDLVHRCRAQLEAGTPGADTQALEFVKTWLQSHVLEADREIGVYLTRGGSAGRRSRKTA
jgi:hemerythrin-like metal-binding protein